MLKNKDRMILYSKANSKLKLLFALLLFCGSSSLFAATKTWDGGAGTGNWADAANWDANTLPAASGDDLVFSGSTQVSTTNNLSGYSFKSIRIGLKNNINSNKRKHYNCK